MIRAGLNFLRSYFCSGESRFFLTVDGKAQVAAIIETFTWIPGAQDFTLRLTIHDRTALTAFINDPHGTAEFEVRAETLRAFAQFLLRRLREEVPAPIASADRLYPEVKPDEPKFDRDDYKRQTGR